MGMTAKESLEMMRSIKELMDGLNEAAPLLYKILSRMLKATSGTDAMGYFEAADLIDKADVDTKDALLLLSVQWMATVLQHQGSDPLLGDILKEIFPDSKMLKLTPGCIITEL